MTTSKVQKISVAFTIEHAAAMKEAVETGDYVSYSEVVREAMRLWTERQTRKQAALERIGKLVDEGVTSGWVGEVSAEDIKQEGRKALGKGRKHSSGE